MTIYFNLTNLLLLLHGQTNKYDIVSRSAINVHIISLNRFFLFSFSLFSTWIVISIVYLRYIGFAVYSILFFLFENSDFSDCKPQQHGLMITVIWYQWNGQYLLRSFLTFVSRLANEFRLWERENGWVRLVATGNRPHIATNQLNKFDCLTSEVGRKNNNIKLLTQAANSCCVSHTDQSKPYTRNPFN